MQTRSRKLRLGPILVDRLKIANRLNDHRPPELTPLNVFVQVNAQGEATKSGVAPEQALELAKHVETLPRLRFCGLMSIPKPETEFDRQRQGFRQLSCIADTIVEAGIECPYLSMGMTADLEAAVAEGATHVRVGTAIFGARS